MPLPYHAGGRIMLGAYHFCGISCRWPYLARGVSCLWLIMPVVHNAWAYNDCSLSYRGHIMTVAFHAGGGSCRKRILPVAYHAGGSIMPGAFHAFGVLQCRLCTAACWKALVNLPILLEQTVGLAKWRNIGSTNNFKEGSRS